MTTFAGWVQNTYAMIKHPLRGQKYDLKHAKEPVVHGFREPSSQRSKSPSSEIRLYTLGNRTAPEYCKERAAGTAPAVPRTSDRVTTGPSVVSNPTRTDGNRSWLHDSWKPGQVKAGIDFFERVAAASVQGAPARPPSPTASIKVKRPAPEAPSQPKPTTVRSHGKKKRAPPPPVPAPEQAKASTAPRGPDSSKPTPQSAVQTPTRPQVMKDITASAKTFTPPPAPPMDGLKTLQRADSAPPPSRPDMSAVFAQLRDHKLVRSDSAPATMGTACESDSAGGGQQISMEAKAPGETPQRDAFQLELMKKMIPAKKAKAIKVKPEVKAQADALRARLEAERNAAQSVSPRRSVDSNLPKTEAQRTYLPNGRFVPNTEQRSLVDELKVKQEARMLKATVAQGG
ncbi:hypothetical protein [Stenotrophomonas oahuensis]|uniref:Uncharacterized protein n=1 Tax=Stenotrophomonas oahuensis TaxID=3003271 RepID=A0ABY9YIW5_9GAMM|nr:hypothetical protein [Stenotrophomonas sp. A5586]WNH50831.1 hypothetical protein PDM29_10510 [Stenotrophomonas sp. A5586]